MGDIRRWIEEQEEDKYQREHVVKEHNSKSEEDIRNEERKKFIDLLEDEADAIDEQMAELLEKRKKFIDLLEDEAHAMDEQMAELLEKGTLGGRKCPQKYIKEFASERKILRDGYISLAEYMRNKN